jgi:hypothetical protein
MNTIAALKKFLRAREFFPAPRIFILIPGTLHALLAQCINNAAPAPVDRGHPRQAVPAARA